MKVLFVKLKEPVVNPPIVPSLGLWSLREIAKLANSENEVTIFDENREFVDLTTILKNSNADIVGISAMFSVQHFEFIKNAAIAKSFGKKVIAGGIHASIIAKEYPDLIDEVCVGEGESWFLKFLGSDKVLNLNEYPNPYSKNLRSEMFSYWERRKPFGLISKTEEWVPFESSRGCPRNCSFCIVPFYWGNWRPISLDVIEKRMQFLFDNGIKEVFISDDNMSANKKHFIGLMKLFKKYGFYWSTPNGFSAKTILDDECFDAIVKTNCWQLQIAFDATTDKSANLLDMKTKFVEHDGAVKIANRLKKAKINSVGFFLIGYPGQTLKDMQDTLDFANSLPLDNRHIHIATPYPGTVLFKDCVDNKWLDCEEYEIYSKLVGNKSYQISVISTKDFTSKQVLDLRNKDREAALRRRNGNG